jgi:hypothetical protein
MDKSKLVALSYLAATRTNSSGQAPIAAFRRAVKATESGYRARPSKAGTTSM